MVAGNSYFQLLIAMVAGGEWGAHVSLWNWSVRKTQMGALTIPKASHLESRTAPLARPLLVLDVNMIQSSPHTLLLWLSSAMQQGTQDRQLFVAGTA